MLVGETWKGTDVDVPPAAAALSDALAMAFSLADPPMAFGALCVVLLCETYQPRPMAPAMIYVSRQQVDVATGQEVRTMSRVRPITQTQRDIRVVPF